MNRNRFDIFRRWTGNMILYLSIGLCLGFILLLINLFNKFWWIPVHIQSNLRSQGIKGPSYRLFHGNVKEILRMKKEATSSSMELSHDLFPRIQPHIYSWIKLHGINYLSWAGPRAELVVSDPDLIKYLLNNKDETFTKPDFGYYISKLFGDGLMAANGNKWLKQRKLANHAFHGENLKGMVPAIIESVEMMLDKWRQNEDLEVEVFKEFKVLTLDVISRTAFGSSYIEGQEIFDMLAKLIVIAYRNAYKVRIPGIEKFIKTTDDKECSRLEQGIRNSILMMINKREMEAKRVELNSYGDDYLGVLLDAYHNPERTKKISIDDLIDECKTFFIGGHETTTAALTWTVLLLAIHQEWQEQARKEVLELFGKQNPTPDGIARMKTMNMIVNESLRLYPPITSITREAQKGARIGNLHVPCKLIVYMPTLALHHDKEIWGEDFHVFKPERFSGGVASATKNNMTAFLPFGMGPRSCVGMNFAIMETKIALSMILQRYKVTLSPTYVHSPVVLIATNPQHGLQVNLQVL